MTLAVNGPKKITKSHYASQKSEWPREIAISVMTDSDRCDSKDTDKSHYSHICCLGKAQ